MFQTNRARSASRALPSAHLPRTMRDDLYKQVPVRPDTIYVGGLKFTTDEYALKDYFSAYGKVISAKVRGPAAADGRRAQPPRPRRPPRLHPHSPTPHHQWPPPPPQSPPPPPAPIPCATPPSPTLLQFVGKPSLMRGDGAGWPTRPRAASRPPIRPARQSYWRAWRASRRYRRMGAASARRDRPHRVAWVPIAGAGM